MIKRVKIDAGILRSEEFVATCRSLPARLVIVTDSNVKPLHGDSLQQFLDCDLIAFPAGEQNKTRATKEYIEDALLDLGCLRDTCLLALGGGVVTDLTGFVAATYCRGVPWIALPTTLLAMVDASIGGKTGVNVPRGKNMIGAFHSPSAVFMDLDLLKTLPEQEYRNGMAETIKHALIADPLFFADLERGMDQKEMIERSVAIKLRIVEQDPEEKSGVRRVLNFGHTVGHALETLSNYTLSHGEAVAIGCVEECKRLQFPPQTIARIANLFECYGFNLSHPYSPEQIEEAMRYDKKSFGGELKFVEISFLESRTI